MRWRIVFVIFVASNKYSPLVGKRDFWPINYESFLYKKTHSSRELHYNVRRKGNDKYYFWAFTLHLLFNTHMTLWQLFLSLLQQWGVILLVQVYCSTQASQSLKFIKSILFASHDLMICEPNLRDMILFW